MHEAIWIWCSQERFIIKKTTPDKYASPNPLRYVFFDGFRVQSDTSNGIGQSQISSLKLIFG